MVIDEEFVTKPKISQRVKKGRKRSLSALLIASRLKRRRMIPRHFGDCYINYSFFAYSESESIYI